MNDDNNNPIRLLTIPCCYTIRLAGHLDRQWSAWFDEMSISYEADDVTVLSGVVADQPALHGILARLRDLPLVILSIQRQ